MKVARTLGSLALTNWKLGLHKEGIPHAKCALEIYGQSGFILTEAESLYTLACLLYGDKQLNAAEDTALRAINLLPDKGEQFRLCKNYRLLGDIHHSKGEKEKTVIHLESAIKIASLFNWHYQLSRAHYSLAMEFSDEHRFDDAHTHIE